MTTRPHAAGLGLVAPLGLWLTAAFALPLAVVVLLAFQPPTRDMFAPITTTLSLAQFAGVLADDFTIRAFANTILLGAAVTLASVVLAYPVALWLVRLPPRWRSLGVALVLVPLLTNVAVRSLGIILLLSPGGIVSAAVEALGFGRPQMLFNWFAVGVALTQVFMPYMVMALYDSLQSVDQRAHEAAAGLGAGPVRRFWQVTLPLSLGGLRGGIVLVFLMTSTAYVSATLLGGKKVWTTGMLVYQEAMQLLNHGRASALALLMLGVSVLATIVLSRGVGAFMPWARGRPPLRLPRIELPPVLARAVWVAAEAAGPWGARALLALGLALLLFPMLLVMISSVNDSPQATVAAFLGFTWKWYGMIFENAAYIRAFRLSFELAAWAVAISLALGLPAAFALARHRLPAHETVGAMLMLPLALPHIAMGVGMLKLLQWYVAVPQFAGLLAIHVVLVAPFVLAMLRATVAGLDRAQEEAAANLGAGPVRRFVFVILPQLAPGLAAAGIIGFLISFGEVTVTALLSTARMQTLPVRIYAEATFSLENTVNALSTLIIIGTVLMLLLVDRFVRLDRVWHR